MPTPTWKELQQQLEQRQTGEVEADSNNNAAPGDAGLRQFIDELRSRNLSPAATAATNAEGAMAGYLSARDRTQEAYELGYGEGRRDYTIPFDIFAEDSNEARAQRQTQASKVINGLLKAVPTAAAAFIDNMVGLYTGMFNVGWDLGDGDEFHPMDSFISNPLSESMQSLREWADRVLPNYRTNEEIADDDQWWKHLNGNFWGDVFLKNLGFTVGAMASGVAWSKISNAITGPMMRNAYKTALAAAGGDAEAEAIFQALLRGEKVKAPKKIYDAFEKFVNTQKRVGIANTIVGGIGGAMGESRMEALGAAKEFRDAENQDAIADFYSKRDALEKKWAGVEMTPENRAAYEREMAAIVGEYNAKRDSIDELADGVANTTFWLNMPVLTASNIVMGARMFAGGYDTQAKTLVRGTMGNYNMGNSILRGVGKAAGNTLTEGMEELTQKMISEGAKDIAEARIGTFNNGRYDKNATRGVSEWLMSMLNSAGNVVIDPKSWEEFAVGALTGALGGGPARGGGWSGGIIGGFQEGYGTKQSRAEDQAAIDAVNERIKDPKFKELWEGLVRHNHFEDIKNVALGKDQRFIWHGANDAQILSDVMMFADIGRLRDLEKYVESFSGISDMSTDELKTARDLAAGELHMDVRNVSDAKLASWLNKRAGDVKKAINQYRSFYDTIDYMSLGTTDKKVIEELIYTQAQLQNAEERYGDILDGVLNNLHPQLERVAKETKEDGMPTARAEKAKKLLSNETNLRTLFGGQALDIEARENTNVGKMAQLVDDATQDAALNMLEQLGAFADKPQLKQDVSDLQKLVRSRQKLYSVLFNPSGRHDFAKSVEENAETVDDAVADLQKDARKNAVDRAMEKLSQAKSLQDFHRLFDEIDQATTDDDDTYQMLQERIQADPNLKKFDDATRDAQQFVDDLRSTIDDELSDADPSMLASVRSLQDFLGDFDIIDLIKDMPEGMSVEEAIAEALLANSIDSNDPVAAKLAMQILEQKLKDKEVADRLSKLVAGMNDGGDGNGEGEGDGGNGGGGNGASMYDVVKAAVNVANSLSDENLNAIANGDFSKFPGLTLEQMAELSKLAGDKIAKIRRRQGLDSTDDGDNPDPSTTNDELDPNDPRKVQRHAEYVSGIGQSLPGNMLSIYDKDALRLGRAERNRKKSEENSVSALIHYGSQQFVDGGALAALDAAYRQKNKKEKGLADEGVPVYFIGNPHFIPDNYHNNPFAAKEGSPEIMLAVEIDDDARAILKKAGKSSMIVDERLIDIDGKKYQLIGELWSPTNNFIKSKPESERGAYSAIRVNRQNIWEMAMGSSINQQYKSEVDKSGMGVNGFPVEGKWYVAKYHPTVDTQPTETHEADWTTGERIFTNVDYIMSGRNITGERNADGSYKKHDLKNALQEYVGNGGKYYFAMPTALDPVYSGGTPVKSLDASVNAPLGSLWIATQEPNGAWAWSYVSIGRTGEYDFVANKDTKFVKDMDKLISALFITAPEGATSQEITDDFANRLRWIHDLRDYIYFGDGNTVSLRFENGIPIVYVGDRECLSKEQFYQALKDGNFRFQVSSQNVKNNKINDLLDAHVLTTEMETFVRKGASFGVSVMYNKDSENKDVPPYHAKRIGTGPVAWTPGSMSDSAFGKIGDSKIRNVRIGAIGYQYDPETGEVQYMARGYRNGTPVENGVVKAQVIALGELMSIRGPGGTLMEEYNGKRWEINDKKHMFTNMFETQVGPYTVRMVQRGTNGAIMLVSDDTEWDSLMEIAKEIKPKSYVPMAGAGQREMSEIEAQRAYDEAMKKEGVGNPAADAREQFPGGPVKLGGSNLDALFGEDEDEDDNPPMTTGGEEKRQAEEKDNYDCPPD